MHNSVIQTWVQELTFMQQSVLLASIRGPDGLEKNHVSKLLIRWLRRCVLYSAFESRKEGRPIAILDPYTEGGGSFTGPSVSIDCADITDPKYIVGQNWQQKMDRVVGCYMLHLDETPHHFQLHFMHAAEIIGYMHPLPNIGSWWERTYRRLAADMHLNPETREQMCKRLGDNRGDWLAAEEVIADGPRQ